MVFPKDLFLGLCCLLYMLMSFYSSKLLLLLDDINKLYHAIYSPEDCRGIDTNVLFEWSKYWLLSFNVAKCKVVHIGSAPYVGNYCLND